MKVCVYIDSETCDAQYYAKIRMLKIDLLLNKHKLDFIDFANVENVGWNELAEKSADAYVFTPCGIAATAKFYQHLNLKDVGVHSKPLILYNLDGYFDPILNHIDEWCYSHEIKLEDIGGWYSVAITEEEISDILNKL